MSELTDITEEQIGRRIAIKSNYRGVGVKFEVAALRFLLELGSQWPKKERFFTQNTRGSPIGNMK